MKVIFIKSVKKIGQVGEVKDFPEGYVRNFLIPQKIVEEATEKALAKLNGKKQDEALQKKMKESLFEQVLRGIGDEVLCIKVAANEKGHLFQSVREKDIAHEISLRTKITIPESSIKIAAPIKELGVSEIGVIHEGKKYSFRLQVIAK